MGSLVKTLNFREGEWSVPVTQLEGDRPGIGTTAWRIPKPVFFQDAPPFAQPHPHSLPEKSRPDHSAGLRHSERLRPCPACLPAPVLPQISSPLCPTFLRGIAQGGSLTLTRPLDQAGATLPEVTEHAQDLCPTQAQCPPDCPARVEAAFPASASMQRPRLEPHCVQMPRGGQGTGLTSPPTRHSTSVAKHLEREKNPNQTHMCRARPMGFLSETCSPTFSHVPLTCSSDLTKRRPLGRAGAWPVARGQCPPSVPPGWAVRGPVGTTPTWLLRPHRCEDLPKQSVCFVFQGPMTLRDTKGGTAGGGGGRRGLSIPSASGSARLARSPRGKDSQCEAPTVHTTKEGTEAKPEEGTGGHSECRQARATTSG